MGSSPQDPDFQDILFPTAEGPLPRNPDVRDERLFTGLVPAPPPERRLKYGLLLLATLLTTTVAGALHYSAYRVDFGTSAVALPAWQVYASGLWYSLSILGILGAHEMGHYVACRYYGVDASLPYFLPAPVLTGTLGAFIRIRQPIATKRELFDIGIAGPIAGFVVAVPVLVVGLLLSNVIRVPPNLQGLELGEPLLFRVVAWLCLGSPPDGYSINLHPMAFAAWFGLLATALNLFPIGQLDGGHISYAVLGRRSTTLTYAMVGCLLALSFVSSSWIVWTVLTVGMLFVFGARHPRTIDEDIPLDRGRLWLAAFALLMFVLCFTPTPIEPLELVRPQPQPARAPHEVQASTAPTAGPRPPTPAF
jgi:NADH:ubiquinone oxidoreductase subunit 6 (subunit J)